jgi:hypothetical protein
MRMSGRIGWLRKVSLLIEGVAKQKVWETVMN